MLNITRSQVLIAFTIAALTLLGYFKFPGHTYLQSDTQIYAPMLEHIWDHTTMTRDFMVERPHLAFTAYDEIAVLLRRLTGLDFEGVLTIQQLFFRALGILGVFLIASSLKLGARMALLVAGVFSLGAFIGGATVLTLEYEPVPRGFAIPLLLLAIGLVAHGLDWAAGVAASIAFLYQPGATIPFWAVYFCLACWPGGVAVMKRRILGLLPLLAAAILLLILSRLQPGISEPLNLLGRVDAGWEKLLRLRTNYIFVSVWLSPWYWHYAILGVVALGAYWRLRTAAGLDLRFFLGGLPLLGLLSIPFSYALLEVYKSAAAPQLQPARGVLFVTLFAGVLASVAGVKAAQAGRHIEGFFWLLAAFLIPAGVPVQQILATNLGDPVMRRRLLIAALLSAAVMLAAWAQSKHYRWEPPVWAALLLLPFLLYPGYGKVVLNPQLHTSDLHELSEWARTSTPKEAVFLFPDAARDLYPGIFRASAFRAVYVDWKSGGQVNYVRSVGEEWYKRWEAMGQLRKFKPSGIGRYAAYDIDYLVVRAKNRVPNRQPAFQNESFIAYALR